MVTKLISISGYFDFFRDNRFGFATTVHKDVSERLKTINESLYKQAKAVLEQNKMERHIRGGMATKYKYENLRKR